MGTAVRRQWRPTPELWSSSQDSSARDTTSASAASTWGHIGNELNQWARVNGKELYVSLVWILKQTKAEVWTNSLKLYFSVLTLSFLSQWGSEQLPDSSAPAEEEQESSGDVQQHLGGSADRPLTHGPARTFPGSKCGRSGPSNEGLQHGHVIKLGPVKSIIH